MSALDYDKKGLQRLIGFIIDINLVSIFIVVLTKMLNIKSNIRGYLFVVLFILYYILTTYFTERQTIGKRVFKLKAINRDSSKIQFYRLILKVLLIIPIILIFGQIDFIVIKHSQGKRSLDAIIPAIYIIYFSLTDSFLHDKITKTKVIKY